MPEWISIWKAFANTLFLSMPSLLESGSFITICLSPVFPPFHTLFLFSNQSSWLIPIGYMRSCPRSGAFHVMEALKREDPTTSVMKATKMLNVCKSLMEHKGSGGVSWPVIEKGIAEVKSLIHKVFPPFFSFFLSPLSFLPFFLPGLNLSLFSGNWKIKAQKWEQWGGPPPLLSLRKDQRLGSSVKPFDSYLLQLLPKPLSSAPTY